MHAGVETVRVEGGVLAELYVRHSPDALRLAYLLTGDRALAEDVVQDAFVRLSGRLIHLRDPNGFRAYLRTTVVNLTRSHFRRRAIEQRYVERQAGSRQAEARGVDVVERDAMLVALHALTPRQRAAVVLRFYEDLSEAETADVLRCRPGTVKSLVSRGMETLRPLMEEDGDA